MLVSVKEGVNLSTMGRDKHFINTVEIYGTSFDYTP